MPIEKRITLSRPSKGALTTGLLAASLTLNLYPVQSVAAEPAHIVQPSPDTHVEPLTEQQINQVRHIGHVILVSIQNFGDQINPPDRPKPPVTDANSTDTANWMRCVKIPESNNQAHTPGTGGEFGFLGITWRSEPYAHIWQSQQPPGADWSEPWKAPVRVQEQEALLLYEQNGGFGAPAWNNGANCGKAG